MAGTKTAINILVKTFGTAVDGKVEGVGFWFLDPIATLQDDSGEVSFQNDRRGCRRFVVILEGTK